MTVQDQAARELESAPVLHALEISLFESEATSDGSDAAHWVRVYSQLARFCSHILAEIDVPEGDINRTLVSQRREHFEQRRKYWTRRLEAANLA